MPEPHRVRVMAVDPPNVLARHLRSAGHFDALIAVALIHGTRPGGGSQAEQALRLAALGGCADAQLLLGALLTSRDPDQAETAYRAAIEGGVSAGWYGLAAVLRDRPGREADLREARDNCGPDGR